ncbi:hypothetical protein B0T13DRAFT_2966 [Neurospora crassa]|nr:hypothetical protein B0T13DRAFT_2966 [Neurospora crassa]
MQKKFNYPSIAISMIGNKGIVEIAYLIFLLQKLVTPCGGRIPVWGPVRVRRAPGPAVLRNGGYLGQFLMAGLPLSFPLWSTGTLKLNVLYKC